MALFGAKKRLGEQLVDAKLITQEQLEMALAEQRERKTKLGETLMQMGFMTAESFRKFFSTTMGIPSVSPQELKAYDAKAVEVVGDDLVRRHQVLPFAFDEDNINAIHVAMAEPNNLGIIDDIEMASGMEVVPHYAPQTELAIILDKIYGKKNNQEVVDAFIEEHKSEFGDEEEKEEEDTVGEAPIVKIVRNMIQQSVREGASDIHIEPLEKSLRIRSRVDGMLQQDAEYALTMLAAMTARIKIISGLDISEKRKPQDGRLTYVVDGVEYDVRVSILPTVYGEKTVMRLTKKQGLTQEKKFLGLYPDDEARLDGIMNNPHGVHSPDL